MKFKLLLASFVATFTLCTSIAQNSTKLEYSDIFDLEWASNPQISPNGNLVVYKRNGFDIYTDTPKGNLWVYNLETKTHEKLTTSDANESQATWSPSGNRLAFVCSTESGSEIFMYWLKTGRLAKLTQLEGSPSNLTWSPNGKNLAFTMLVAKAPPVLITMPSKPKGAEWAKPARITDRLKHEADGRGYLKPGFSHIFIMPADGGTPRQITSGDFNHGGSFSFSPSGNNIFLSANRNSNWEYEFRSSFIYKVAVNGNNSITQLTDEAGPAHSPVVSPNGKYIAFLGYVDKIQAYQTTKVWIMDTNGKNKRVISKKLDRSISSISWANSNNDLLVTYDTEGNTKIGKLSLNGNITELAANVGGTTLGRPYASGSLSLSQSGTVVYTYTTPKHPAELASFSLKNKEVTQLTNLNADVLSYKTLGEVEPVWYKSSVDGRDIQGWIVKPPFYDSSKKYPLLVENHGGPILNYGDRFTAEIQLYAAAGYLVFYPNPRGSTSYGEDFGNLLYNNYPGEDYNDVMDGVDYLINKNLVDLEKLFVTGGSAGGIMTAWIIGKNNRFKAAVVAKPVMNWISKTLVADNYYGYANSRYPGQPWENFDTYWKFSPISLVGNVETPTMVMVGLNDLRTPPSEAKQLYHALKLRKIETVLVELPGASHGIAKRPSQLISKVAHTLGWFDKYLEENK